MEIKNIQNMQFKRPGFGMRRLFSFYLQSGNNQVRAYVSELKKTDRSYIEKNRRNWESTTFGTYIIDDFLDKKNETSDNKYFLGAKNFRFFVIEVPSSMNQGKKLIGLAQVCFNDNYVDVMRLQSLNEKSETKIKGAGSCLLYAVCKIAEKLKKEGIEVYAVDKAVKFYPKIGFKKKSYTSKYLFSLLAKRFKKFQRNLELRYDISQIGRL